MPVVERWDHHFADAAVASARSIEKNEGQLKANRGILVWTGKRGIFGNFASNF